MEVFKDKNVKFNLINFNQLESYISIKKIKNKKVQLESIKMLKKKKKKKKPLINFLKKF